MSIYDNYTGPIIVLVGPAGTGKSYLADLIAPPGSASRIRTYTTRPPRENESDGQSDHVFVDSEEFERFCFNKAMICVRRFRMGAGQVVSYGVRKRDVERPADVSYKAIVLDPNGAEKFVKTYPQTKVFWLTLPDRDERIARLVRRGDKVEDIRARLAADAEDFVKYTTWDDPEQGSLFRSMGHTTD